MIKIGEYVKTKSGVVGKIIARHEGYGLLFEIDKDEEIQNNFKNRYITEDYITKHSLNLIDLIEVRRYDFCRRWNLCVHWRWINIK